MKKSRPWCNLKKTALAYRPRKKKACRGAGADKVIARARRGEVSQAAARAPSTHKLRLLNSGAGGGGGFFFFGFVNTMCRSK